MFLHHSDQSQEHYSAANIRKKTSPTDTGSDFGATHCKNKTTKT